MGNNKRQQDTLFIDMKYIVLYRKLGYKEIKPDVFVYEYNDTKITIESENQRFFFKGKWNNLLTYKDMVLLECIDRLLKKGYSENDLQFCNTCDLAIIKNQISFASIFIAEWDKQHFQLHNNYLHTTNDLVILYTSQLSGGLIDFKSKIYANNNIYDKGFFEKNIKPFQPDYSTYTNSKEYSCHDFVIENDELIKYIGNDKKVDIPVGISKIGTGAFWNNTIVEEIFIPGTVTCIAGDAFVYCDNLKKVEIPQSICEIGDNPFAGCPKLTLNCFSKEFILEDGILFDKDKRVLIHYTPSKTESNYVIPESVEWVGKHSFYKCLNLFEVVVSKNVAFIGNNVFSDCLNIRLINKSPYFEYIDGVLYNKDMTQVFHYSMGSGVKDVMIKEGVRTIGRNSFWNAKMIETITIPSTVRQIGYNPFAYCLNAVFINHSPFFAETNGILYSYDMKELVCCTSKTAEKEIRLPQKLISIGRNAFTGCEALRNITLPEGLESISRGAFAGCINLTEITIPQSVKMVGDWAFNNCTKLKTIKIPANVKIEMNLTINCPAEIIKY